MQEILTNAGCCAFLDSGIGGLPYLSQLKKLSPNMPCAYIADTANFPYGKKGHKQVIEAASSVVAKIISRLNPSTIVIACNTISVAALDSLRKSFGIPIIGTVPAIKKAAAVSANKIIGFIATEGTVKDTYTTKLIADFASGCKMVFRAAPDLVREIEGGLIFASDEEKLAAVLSEVKPFMEGGADTVVLGCTHFLHLQETFCSALGKGIRVVDSLEGVVSQALRVSSSLPLNEEEIAASSLFVTSPLPAEQREIYERCCKLYGLLWEGLL